MSEARKKRVRRARATRPGVRAADRVARALITVGGLGTIAAVATLCVFLVWVVVPLFRAPKSTLRAAVGVARTAPLAVGVNEYLTMGWAWSGEGELELFRLSDGTRLASQRPLADLRPSALALSPSEATFLAGDAEGYLHAGAIGFATRYVEAAQVGGGGLTPELLALAPGESEPYAGGMLERTNGAQLRLQELELTREQPFASGTARPILLADHIESTGGRVLATLAEDGVLRLVRRTRKKNLLTGKETFAELRGELALELPDGRAPGWLLLSGLGDNVFLLWADGTLWRCDARELTAPIVVQKTDVLPEPEVQLTRASFLIGRTSLALGDSRGRVRVWFRTKPPEAGTPDGIELALAHELAGDGAAVSALAPSARGRMLAAGYADGRVRLFHVTSQSELFAHEHPGGRTPVTAVALGPKDDALIAAGAGGTAVWSLDAPHPETSLAAIFRPVWYEGYAAPEHVWQSSSGTDDFEPKYGLVPLVFGTIKATFYSLLFGVPLALLAAVYTSEFLSRKSRARVKPAIEMMASLPSVVLGFLSALVLAPLIEDVVPAVLATITLLPFAALLGGHAWRALPASFALRHERRRLVPIAGALGLALGAGVLLGRPLEHALFAGDLRQWLTGTIGRGTGGWALLLLPVVALCVAWLSSVHLAPGWARATRALSRERFARLDLAKFVGLACVVLALTWLVAEMLTRLGLDPRGGLLDNYVQRNALVVGFVMGFAIIPIVYTIAEDALSAVPDHLRAASLGAGATPWQTTVRVVVPTAMSGIFSAVMIGFGRAVGETMIVLMAAGNTPVMEWNVFNGFRTLSANIAVELPEAVQGSTHYRMLFLAALVLFAMTFVLNTLAELVRQRYRRRRVQL
jgi:phosphate transport system permease protein